MPWRYRISIALEAALWAVAMGWLLFLGGHALAQWRTEGTLNWRDLSEIVLLALLVYWPILRTRIVHGYWMRDWEDTPKERARRAQWTDEEVAGFAKSDKPPIVTVQQARLPRRR